MDIFRSGYKDISECLNNSIVSLLRFSSFIGSIFLGCYLLYKLVCFITIKHPVKGISINGNQLVVDNDKLPFFDKYLDEILYLFDNCNADAIVFEDIDRFDSVKVFERIKEVIYLANIKRINAGTKKLKFFFLLRDDIFKKAKERTKFFDVIIPIIPVVDSSNSYDKILERIESFPYDKKINNDFLKGLSVYIDDMRMLTNIVNEFIIYNEQLADIKLDLNKLFAIITYKNLFPDDFIKLQYHSGFVYTCFKYKNDFSGKLLGKIDSRINEIQKNIALFEYSSDTENQLPDSKNEAPISDEVLKIKQNLYHDINELDNQKNNIISSDSLSSLLQCIDNSNLFFDEVSTIYSGTKAIKRNEYFDLLVFLLVNGYLDENYPDYITYFYGKALSKNDKNYICSIFEGRNVKYQYKLDNIQNVIDKLPASLFLKKGIFNFDIFDLLLTDRRYEEKKKSLMCVLLLDKDGSSFVSAFLNEGRNFKECIMEINGKDPSYFSKTVLIYDDLFSNEIKHKYVVYSLSFCSKKTLQEMNEKNSLVEYICTKNDFLVYNWNDIDEGNVIHSLKTLGIKFDTLSDDINEKRLELIFKYSLYTLNIQNIRFMLRKIYNKKNNELSDNKLLTAILEYGSSYMHKYMIESFDSFLKIYAKDNSSCKLQDDESIVIKILNLNELHLDLKTSYIKLIDIKINDISEIKNKVIQRALLSNNKLSFTVKNIFTLYIHRKKFSAELLDFINGNDPIELENNIDFINSERFKNFYLAFISNENINLPIEQRFINMYKDIYIYNFRIRLLRNDIIKMIINLDYIKQNEDNMAFIRANYPLS